MYLPMKTKISLCIRIVGRLTCPHENILRPWLSEVRPVKILIRLRDV